MKKVILTICSIIFIALTIQAQKIDTLKLKVVGYKELKDCFIIRTYNIKTSDSIFLISVKDKLISKHNFERIVIGKEYYFQYDEDNSKPAYPTPIALRVKSTVVWAPGEDPKKIPLYCSNATGLYVRKIKRINK